MALIKEEKKYYYDDKYSYLIMRGFFYLRNLSLNKSQYLIRRFAGRSFFFIVTHHNCFLVYSSE